MKLILLRHEKREDYPGFYSNLTSDGLKDSIKLEKKLNKIDIDIIFCSPFIRTIQTIYPYSFKNNKKINIEYALHEYKHNPYFLFENEIYSIKDIKDKNLTTIINNNYKSKFSKNDFNIIFLENEEHLQFRLNIFLRYLFNNKNLKDKTILLVSHKGVINRIKKTLGFDISMDNNFKMGSYEIFDF